MNPTQRDWIYESPDKGETVFRRKSGDPYFKREQVNSKVQHRYYEGMMWEYRKEWDNLADQYPAVKEYLDKLITIIKLVD